MQPPSPPSEGGEGRGTAVEIKQEGNFGLFSLAAPWSAAPTGLRPKAQGCRAAATLGTMGTEGSTPTGLRLETLARGHNPGWGCSFLGTPTQGRPAARANPHGNGPRLLRN